MKAINRLVTMLGLLLLFGVIALVISLDMSVILGLLEPASPTPTLTTTATPIKMAAYQTTSPIPVIPQPGWQVCTGVADGHLHVRASARTPGIHPGRSARINHHHSHRPARWRLAHNQHSAGWLGAFQVSL